MSWYIPHISSLYLDNTSNTVMWIWPYMNAKYYFKMDILNDISVTYNE